MVSELGDQREGEWVEGRRIKWKWIKIDFN